MLHLTSAPGRRQACRASSPAASPAIRRAGSRPSSACGDVTTGQQVAGQQYFTDPNNWRRVGHIISDAVYSKITGFGGFFDTRIVFVDESGPKENRRKRLAIMDQDGANVRYLTQGDSSVVTPRYSPATQDITYSAQIEGQQPRVQVINLETGSRQVLGNFPDMAVLPALRPDGQRIVMSLQQGGNANIFMMDLGSRATTRLTSTAAIDTSPSFSPTAARSCSRATGAGSSRSTSWGRTARTHAGSRSGRAPTRSPRGRRGATTSDSPSARAGASPSAS
jgi:TolB protein